MSQALNTKITGLYTHPNELGSVPEGALSKANNIVIDKESIAEPRRGFNRLEYSFSDVNDRADRLFTYQDKIITHYTGDKLAYSDGSSWIDYSGTYSHPDSALAKIRAIEANSNLYLTTGDGIKVLDVYSGPIYNAGMVRGLDCQASLSGASGFLVDDSQVAYRVLWGFKDANNNLILGVPSQRAVVSNSTGGTRDISLQVTIPSGISTLDFYQVYRSAMSADASTEPNDEMQLVYEGNPTSGEITAKTLTVTDQTPEDLRGADLYTNASQEGLAQGNEIPPFAKDIAAFKGCVFYGNTRSKHRLIFTILAIGGTSGIAANDVLTIAGTTYTGKASETIASREFKVSTGGSPSQNIADTALSLVRVINQNSTNTSVYAFYLSGYNDLPGKILIEERAIGGSAFTCIASAHGTAYNPPLPTSGSTVSSSNDTYKHAVYISKLQQPEAVPLTNVLFLGSASKSILRLISLRDSLFILKEDGIWRITGSSPANFQPELIDSTTRLIAPDSAVVLNNSIFALSDQGVVNISDTGVQVVSRPIENNLLELFGLNLQALKETSFGVSYESERKFILFTITSAADLNPTQAFVYNTFTNSWTKWTLAKTCGIVNPADDKLYLGNALSKHIVQERKSFSFRDYIDEGEEFELTSVDDDKTLYLTGSLADLKIGDLVFESASVFSPITAIDLNNNSVTVRDQLDWSLAPLTIYSAIKSEIEWLPNTGGNPGLLKHYREIVLFFKNQYFSTAKIGFFSDMSGSLEEVDVGGSYGGLWGLMPWGSGPWGGIQRPKPIRTYVPLEKARCSQISVKFTHQEGYTLFQLAGLSLQFNLLGERVAR